MFAETLQSTASVQPGGMRRCCIRIGKVSIGLSASSEDNIQLDPELNAFRIDSTTCDIEVDVEWADLLPKPRGKKLFDSGSIWTLYKENHGFVFDFATPVLGCQPYKRLLVNEEFSTAQLLLNRKCLPQGKPVCPLEYPLDELLVTNWLATSGRRG